MHVTCFGVCFLLLFSLFSRLAASLVNVEINKTYVHKVDEKFLSVTIDISGLKNHFANKDLRNPTLVNLTRVFSPGILRIGGTAAENVTFDPNVAHRGPSNGDSIKMTMEDWEEINTFTSETGLQLLFDLNDELRKGYSWDPSNAEELLKVTSNRKYGPLWWQLGNGERKTLGIVSRSQTRLGIVTRSQTRRVGSGYARLC